MATQFLRSSKIEARGQQMMSALVIRSHALPSVRRYFIARVRKEPVDFYTRIFGGGWLLISSRNPLPRRKNSPNTGEACLLQHRRNTTENGREIDALVTTSHVLLPVQRRKTVLLLPISRPNAAFLEERVQHRRPPGGRGSARRRRPKHHIDNVARKILLQMGRPAPFRLPLKRMCCATVAHSQRSDDPSDYLRYFGASPPAAT
jgi:hypothetical protein